MNLDAYKIVSIFVACMIGAAAVITSVTFIIQALQGEPTVETETASLITDLISDPKSWMSQLPLHLKREPIIRLAIPGAHGSFTSYIYKNDSLHQFKANGRAYENLTWYRTQEYNVTQLLTHGVRYLDLKFCANYRAVHNFYYCIILEGDDKLRGILAEIVHFLKAHPKEIIIIDCSRFQGFKLKDHLKLLHRIEAALNVTMVPYIQNAIESVTLYDMNKDGKQVLVIYRDPTIKKQYPLFWPGDSFPASSYATKDPNDLIHHLEQNVGGRSLMTGSITHLFVTPGTFPNLTNVTFANLTNVTSSRLKVGVDLNFEKVRNSWIAKQKPGPYGQNVILGDYVDLNKDSFIKNVVNLNLKYSFPALSDDYEEE